MSSEHHARRARAIIGVIYRKSIFDGLAPSIQNENDCSPHKSLDVGFL